MSIWGIFVSAFLIGFSGAAMPGPMLGVAIDGSIKKGFAAGPLLVLGHGILEILLIIIIAFGLKDFFSNSAILGIIGILGGVYLAWMGLDMIKSSFKKTISLEKQEGKNTDGKNLVLTGAAVSAANPYFILWWASTGLESIRQAYVLGITGVMAFSIGHILSDLSWYSAVSFTFSKGKKLINDNIYRWIIFILGIFVLLFSVKFIAGGWAVLTY